MKTKAIEYFITIENFFDDSIALKWVDKWNNLTTSMHQVFDGIASIILSQKCISNNKQSTT